MRADLTMSAGWKMSGGRREFRLLRLRDYGHKTQVVIEDEEMIALIKPINRNHPVRHRVVRGRRQEPRKAPGEMRWFREIEVRASAFTTQCLLSQ